MHFLVYSDVLSKINILFNFFYYFAVNYTKTSCYCGVLFSFSSSWSTSILICVLNVVFGFRNMYFNFPNTGHVSFLLLFRLAVSISLQDKHTVQLLLLIHSILYQGKLLLRDVLFVIFVLVIFIISFIVCDFSFSSLIICFISSFVMSTLSAFRLLFIFFPSIEHRFKKHLNIHSVYISSNYVILLIEF